MKTGLLNEFLSDIEFSVGFEGSERKLETVSRGNPLSGKPLSVSWQVARNSPIELRINLKEECFVDCVEIEAGEETDLKSLVLSCDGYKYGEYTAETGKSISVKDVRLEGGFLAEKFSVVLLGDFSDIEVCSIKVFGAMKEAADIFPIPKKAEYADEIIPASVFSSYCADCEDGLRAGKVLCEKFFEIAGVLPTESDSGSIRFVRNEGMANDGFELEVGSDGAKISASNFRGFVLGAESFIKLCEKDGVRKAKVADSPFMPFRGVHLMLPSLSEMDFAKRLIKYMISPLGYNAVIIEVAGGMQYESHPEINEAVMNAISMNKKGLWPKFPHSSAGGESIVPKAAVSEFVEYIRSFGIEVIPEVQSLGHVQFMTQAYPDIAEIEEEDENRDIDTRGEDARPEKFYRHSYCPSNPKSYEILFDLLDEVIEVFKPTEYVHMGHDEVYEIGVCPICRHKDPAKLFADDVNKIYNYLKERGLKMMIWSDMIQPVTKYLTPAAIDMIPKDILMLDFIWYFHFEKNLEDNLLEKGYKVAVGNLYSSHYPRYETRIRKSGMVGGQISAWVGTNEPALQAEGKLYDFILTAEMLWDEAYSKRHTLSYDNIIRGLMPSLRENLREIKYPSRSEGAEKEILLENKYDKESEKEISVSGDFQSIVFDHTELVRMVRLPWQKHDEVGKYILAYDDGTEEIVPITSCGNIGYYNRRQNEPLDPQLYRHSGYISTYFSDSVEERTESGQKFTLYRFEHILLKGKKLKNIRLCENEKFNTKIFVRRIVGIK